MKNTLTCPKCQGRKLWRIERLHTRDLSHGMQVGDELLLAAGRRTPPTHKANWLGSDGSQIYSCGHIDALVCAACGYTELWSRGHEHLVHNPADGVTFIDGSLPRSEYR